MHTPNTRMAKPPVTTDRRQFGRIAADIVSRLVINGASYPCNILDLSLGGAALEVTGTVPLENKRVVLDLGGILLLKCKIVRRFEHGVGVRFYTNELRQGGAKERLADLMRAHAQR